MKSKCKILLIEIQTMVEVSCLPSEVMLLRPLRSLYSSATRKTAASVFFSALTYTGLLSIFAKPWVCLAVENEWLKFDAG